MDNEKRQALSVYRMEQAEETLTAAKMCLEYHLYKDCINRSYYVAFYAVKAVLAIEGVDFKRHKDAVAYFNKTYVASGKVSREVGKRLGRIKTVREFVAETIGVSRQAVSKWEKVADVWSKKEVIEIPPFEEISIPDELDDEIAALVLFLASDMSGMINGEAIVADMGAICG